MFQLQLASVSFVAYARGGGLTGRRLNDLRKALGRGKRIAEIMFAVITA
jgi:hypothetical protein